MNQIKRVCCSDSKSSRYLSLLSPSFSSSSFYLCCSSRRSWSTQITTQNNTATTTTTTFQNVREHHHQLPHLQLPRLRNCNRMISFSSQTYSTNTTTIDTMTTMNHHRDKTSHDDDHSVSYVFPPPTRPIVKIRHNNADQQVVFPVHRIYCVAKNYVDHIKEMGDDPNRETPCFFTKPPDAIVDCCSVTTNTTGITKIPYPLSTSNLHYEIELVIAIQKGGCNIAIEDAKQHIYGYTVGCDLTRRDLQNIAKSNGRPWDSSKGFDHSAPIGSIIPLTELSSNTESSLMNRSDVTNIWLQVDDTMKQKSTIQHMIWNIYEIISHLSKEFVLQPGDLIFTGTPAGVGPIVVNDIVTGGIDHIGQISFQITNRDLS